ncbi:YbjN domain-containing protein [Symplocastrum sp. BBK-W-15]|uniref:YbjN domain-containing protein n=1 Tax=Limnofasciculus baicalensis BBK-W-15 TaxID=2699891 RepID=A0AAE3GSL0_9CYAN|nr:YbjN domain-containing protein [Limnofasciculus baicalensis BBK-W-15]
MCPISAPESKRLAIAEFITRANYGMMIGNFELDFSDGEIRYKTGIDVEGDKLTSALINHLVYANLTMMDEYLPGIRAVIENNVFPQDAIAQIEQ